MLEMALMYLVLRGAEWYEPAWAKEIQYGWLMWKDQNGKTGLSRPGDWKKTV